MFIGAFIILFPQYVIIIPDALCVTPVTISLFTTTHRSIQPLYPALTPSCTSGVDNITIIYLSACSNVFPVVSYAAKSSATASLLVISSL